MLWKKRVRLAERSDCAIGAVAQEVTRAYSLLAPEKGSSRTRDPLNNFVLKLFSTQMQKHPRALSLPLLAAFTLRGFSFAHNRNKKKPC